MRVKKILIILGEPNSVFSEILFKYFKKNNLKLLKKKIILIGSYELITKQMKILKYKLQINLIKNIEEAKLNKINMLNINYKFKKVFTKISSNSNRYLTDSFDLAIDILKKRQNDCFA